MSVYTDMIEDARKMSDVDLEAATQGCTELSCLYHGPLNEVMRERRLGRFSEVAR